MLIYIEIVYRWKHIEFGKILSLWKKIYSYPRIGIFIQAQEFPYAKVIDENQ